MPTRSRLGPRLHRPSKSWFHKQRKLTKALAPQRLQGNQSIFDAIAAVGHDEDYTPTDEAVPTDARPGSLEKLEIMQRRVQAGQPLFVDGDTNCLGDRTFTDDDDDVQRQSRRLLDEMSQKVDDDGEF